MILDTSAVVVMVMKEPGFEELLRAMNAHATIAIGAATLTETAIVLSARLADEPLLSVGDDFSRTDIARA
jgi:uncharacterized protein with PIN domain